jgi:hypothetical protein
MCSSESHASSSSVRGRASSESRWAVSNEAKSGLITLTPPGSNAAATLRQDHQELVLLRLQEALSDAKDRGVPHLKLDRSFVEAIVKDMVSRKAAYSDLKGTFDGVKVFLSHAIANRSFIVLQRASMQYIEGLTVAQTEYDRELKARRDAEAEVTRLRVLLSGQAARLTAMSGDSRKQELRQQMSKELNENLSGLEHSLSKLKVQRDMALAEVEELTSKKSVLFFIASLLLLIASSVSLPVLKHLLPSAVPSRFVSKN